MLYFAGKTPASSFLTAQRDGPAFFAVGTALIIFDIDGTLLQSDRVTVPAVQQTLAGFGLPIPDAVAICAFFGRPTEDYQRWLAQQCPPERAKEIVAATDKRELEFLGGEERLYDGVRGVLGLLRENGHALAICSNGPDDYVNEFLDVQDLRHFFDAVRCRGTKYSGKTEMVAEILECIPSRPAMVVGDRDDDIEAAHANGAHAIAAAYGFGSARELADADVTVHAPSEIPAAVETLLSAERI